jgi:hypothetical protein
MQKQAVLSTCILTRKMFIQKENETNKMKN